MEAVEGVVLLTPKLPRAEQTDGTGLKEKCTYFYFYTNTKSYSIYEFILRLVSFQASSIRLLRCEKKQNTENPDGAIEWSVAHLSPWPLSSLFVFVLPFRTVEVRYSPSGNGLPSRLNTRTIARSCALILTVNASPRVNASKLLMILASFCRTVISSSAGG